MLGHYTDGEYNVLKGRFCVRDYLYSLIESNFKGTIFAHNGGKYDFLFLMKWLKKEKIAYNYIFPENQGRIIKLTVQNNRKENITFKDSYMFFQDSLDNLMFKFYGIRKREVEYTIEFYTEHEEESLEYLQDDCMYLSDILTKFKDKFTLGNSLSVAGLSFRILRKDYKQEMFFLKNDPIRHDYYGGRVEIFKSNQVTPEVYHYDVNSLYPYAMSLIDFPKMIVMENDNKIDKKGLYLVDLKVKNKQIAPLPVKSHEGIVYPSGKIKNYWLDYDSIINYSEDIEILNVYCKLAFYYTFDIRDFLFDYYDKKKNNFEGLETFWKYILNSCYGKFSQRTDRGVFYYNGNKEINEHFVKMRFRGFINNLYSILIVNKAREIMYKYYKEHFNSLVYTDTDSLISNKKIDIPVSREMGDFKLEGIHKNFEPISKKVYYYMKWNEEKNKWEEIIKIKGFSDITTIAEVNLIKKHGINQSGISMRKSMLDGDVQRYEILGKKIKLFNTGRFSNKREYHISEISLDK